MMNGAELNAFNETYKKVTEYIEEFSDSGDDGDSLVSALKYYFCTGETAAYDDAGKLKNIYLAGEYGGFAIHILRGWRKDNLCAKTEKSAIRTDGAQLVKKLPKGPRFW